MKQLIKNILNKIVDYIFLPFELLYNFIKNADNVIYVIIRIILLLIVLFGIIFIIISKPYNKILKGFYFEKYINGDEAKTSITSILPLNENNIDDYILYFGNIGADCEKKSDKKGTFYDCFYYENLIYKKYKWGTFIRIDKNNKITYISILKDKIDNDIITFVNTVKSKFKKD